MRAWKVVVPIAAVASLVSCSTRSYEDCVLEAMEVGVQGDVAAGLIAQACRDKFPIGAKDTQLSASQMESLTGRGAVMGSQWGGSIYNGNEDVTVTEVEIHLTTTVGDEETHRTYRTDVDVPALQAATILFSIIPGDEGAEHTWSIESAKGRTPGN